VPLRIPGVIWGGKKEKEMISIKWNAADGSELVPTTDIKMTLIYLTLILSDCWREPFMHIVHIASRQKNQKASVAEVRDPNEIKKPAWSKLINVLDEFFPDTAWAGVESIITGSSSQWSLSWHMS
jgi:hypothetical protein